MSMMLPSRAKHRITPPVEDRPSRKRMGGVLS
jgi:hypothetical protein